MKQEEGPRSFARFLEALGDGDAHREMSEELYALGQALANESLARDRTAKGSLTLTIKLAAEPKGLVTTSYDIKRKDPPRRTTQGVMFLTPSGNLSATNPRQPDLPGVRLVDPKRAPARDIDDDADELGAKEV